MKVQLLSAIVFLIVAGLLACDGEDEFLPDEVTGTFKAVEGPFVLNQDRYPEGVGFDFVYREEAGGANYLDSLSVSDFKYDVAIKPMVLESKEGPVMHTAYAVLYGDVNHRTNAALAINYSEYDSTMRGHADYEDLELEAAKTGTERADQGTINMREVDNGGTGFPLETQFLIELKKLVIADDWLQAATNDVAGDEPIWVIKTRENRYVKFIILQYQEPATPQGTAQLEVDWTLFSDGPV
jgi:hypothetical protein